MVCSSRTLSESPDSAMPATIRILIVEDNLADAQLAEREVRRADILCTFRRVDTRDGMVAALREFSPDVIITDHSLPHFAARDAIQVAQQLSPGTPVIVVTGRLGDESAVQYLQAGAADYIVKDHLQRLGPAVLRALDTKRSREEQARAHQLQAATYRIAQVALSTPGLQQLWPVIHQIVGELMPAKNFYIALYDAAAELLTFPYFVDEVDSDFPSKRLGKGLTEYVLRTGKPLLVTPEVQEELERRGEVELIGAPSIDWVGVPLKIGDRTIGVLVVQTYAPGVRYGEREKEILQFVSTQVAMAIERHHAEAELRSSEARLKAIIDAALDAVITMDGTGTIRSWSPQAERVFGWPASEVLGRTLSTTIIPPRYRAAHERGLAHFLATGQGTVLNRRIEITGLRRDGREIPVELTITPLRLADAWVFSAFVRDISERRQVEQRQAGQYAVTRILAEATTLAEAGAGILRAICESLDWQAGVLWILDHERDTLRCVEIWRPSDVELGAFERVTKEMTFARGVGLPGEVWASGRAMWHRDVTTLAEPRFPRLAHATAAGVRGAFGFPIRSAAAVTGVVEFFSREPREPDPDLLEMAAALGSQMGQFIERRRAEEALARSEMTYRSLVEDSPFGIFQSAPDGRLLAVNPALVSILGYDSAAELLAQNMARDVYVDPDDRAGLIEEGPRRGSLSAESVWRRKDGKTITVRQTGRAVRDAHGRVESFNVILEDITERQLLEAQFRQAQKMEAVGQLAGGVAHDFNNLLTAILGCADLLLETLGPAAPEREDVEEIRKAARRAADLTRQLLAFSRQQVLAPQVLGLNVLVANLEKLLRRLIGEDIELRTALGAGLGAVKADPGQLEQVIVNLAVNARDAMPDGGRLTIETGNAELDETYSAEHFPTQPGSYVLLAVTDTGTGMDAETKSHIFEPFFTTKGLGKGTGLGLATVYGIVKQSGGYVWVYSEPGQGTSFKIYLPRVVDAPVPAPPAQDAPVSLRGSETILLVEDDEMVRTLTRRLLEANGHTVLLASRGDAALELARSYEARIDLLITDVVMPGMSGRDLADQVQTLLPGIKVLYLSGYTDDAIVRHGVLEPGVAFLQKPFTADTLARKVREVLHGP
jgi:two-component system, cell cycle sensor histidine kinase and response regulator CckA